MSSPSTATRYLGNASGNGSGSSSSNSGLGGAHLLPGTSSSGGGSNATSSSTTSTSNLNGDPLLQHLQQQQQRQQQQLYQQAYLQQQQQATPRRSHDQNTSPFPSFDAFDPDQPLSGGTTTRIPAQSSFEAMLQQQQSSQQRSQQQQQQQDQYQYHHQQQQSSSSSSSRQQYQQQQHHHHQQQQQHHQAAPAQQGRSSSTSSSSNHNPTQDNHPNDSLFNDQLDSLSSQFANANISQRYQQPQQHHHHHQNGGPPASAVQSSASNNSSWTRRTGVVKFFNSTKGFGFIWDNSSNEVGDVDIFVHWTTIKGDASFKSLGEGEIVEYELARGPKGFQAVNVTGLNGSDVRGDPLARMPLALGRVGTRMMPPSRFNPMGAPIPIQALGYQAYAQQMAQLDAYASAAAAYPAAARPGGAAAAAAGAASFLPLSTNNSSSSNSNASSAALSAYGASANHSANGFAGGMRDLPVPASLNDGRNAKDGLNQGNANAAGLANSAFAQYMPASNGASGPRTQSTAVPPPSAHPNAPIPVSALGGSLAALVPEVQQQQRQRQQQQQQQRQLQLQQQQQHQHAMLAAAAAAAAAAAVPYPFDTARFSGYPNDFDVNTPPPSVPKFGQTSAIGGGSNGMDNQFAYLSSASSYPFAPSPRPLSTHDRIVSPPQNGRPNGNSISNITEDFFAANSPWRKETVH